MKPKYKKIFLWLAVILHISLIFSFSLQDAAKSSSVSEGFTGVIKSEEKIREELIEREDKGEVWAKREAKKKFDKLENFLRKVAHFSLFFLLGTLLNLLIGAYDIKGSYRLILCILYAPAVAFADETIQIFSPGRAGRITDVLIDTSGAVLAAIIFVVGGWIYEKNKTGRIKMDS